MPRLLTCLVLLFASCTTSKLDEFDLSRTATAEVAGSPLPAVLQNALNMTGFADMEFSTAQEFKNQGVAPNDVDSIKLRALSLKVVSPPGQDLTFLESVEFFAEAEGKAKVSVAKGGPFAKGVASLALTMTNVELKPYVVAPKMSLTAAVKGHQPNQTTKIEATAVLRVDVDVTGAVTGK